MSQTLMTGIQKIILHTLTVVGEYEPAQYFFLVLLLPKLQTPTVHLKNPPRRQKLLRCLDAVTRAARALLCGRHTDRGCGQSTVMTGGLDPLFAFALGNTKIPGLCAPLGCYTTGTTSNASRSTLKMNSCTTMGKMKSQPFN